MQRFIFLRKFSEKLLDGSAQLKDWPRLTKILCYDMKKEMVEIKNNAFSFDFSHSLSRL